MSHDKRHRVDFELTLRRATSGIMEPRDQMRLVKLTASRARHKTWLFALFILVLVIAGWVSIGIVLPASSAYDLPMMVLGFALVFTGGYVINKRRSPIARRMLSKTLYRKGIRPNFCLRCLYDLKGSVSEQCPECGEKLAPPSDLGQSSND